MTLKEQYADIVQKYLDAFLIKHGFHENGILCDIDWVGNDPGGVVEIADYFFGFEDIRLDIDHEAPVSLIIEYYDYTLEHHGSENPPPNYRSWIFGWKPGIEKDAK